MSCTYLYLRARYVVPQIHQRTPVRPSVAIATIVRVVAGAHRDGLAEKLKNFAARAFLAHGRRHDARLEFGGHGQHGERHLLRQRVLRVSAVCVVICGEGWKVGYREIREINENRELRD